VFTAALATLRQGDRLDVDQLVRRVVEGRLPPRLPRLHGGDARRGCQLLLDFSDSMLPWWEDLRELAAQLAACSAKIASRSSTSTARPGKPPAGSPARTQNRTAALAARSPVGRSSSPPISAFAAAYARAAGPRRLAGFVKAAVRRAARCSSSSPGRRNTGRPPWPRRRTGALASAHQRRDAQPAARRQPATDAMSWLQPTAFEQDLVADVRRRWPEIVPLARLLALATRIEPLLLRNARLHFLPGSATEIESLLWFSPLVGARSSGEVILHAGVARLLADELRGDRARCSTR
jgi:hypothetical protein